jgi:hypothetical protein
MAARSAAVRRIRYKQAARILEQVGEGEVIVVIQAQTRCNISRSGLGHFKRRQNVGRELVDNITGVRQIMQNVIRYQI